MRVSANRTATSAAMSKPRANLARHRVLALHPEDVRFGTVRWAPTKSLWFIGMATGALVGGGLTLSWAALSVFAGSTGIIALRTGRI